jgi:GTP pyrophosphokinase
MEVMNEAIEKTYSDFFEICKTTIAEKDHPRIQDAYSMVYEVFGERCWDSGENIVIHSLEVARVVVQEVGLGIDSVIAALLHNVYYQESTTKLVEPRFGKSISSILEGMAKINTMGTDTVELHSENYRKLMLAMAGDVRVILVKIADRLQVMRHLDSQPESVQTKISIETSFLYAPLAHRLGLYYINSELLDLCLKYQNPDAYHSVSLRLRETD